MKHHLVFLSLFFIGFLSCMNTFAQSAEALFYFNKAYGRDTSNVFSMAGLPVETGYLITGTYVSVTNKTVIFLQKLDAEGNEEWVKVLDDHPNLIGLSTGDIFIQTADNQFLVAYAEGKDSNEADLDIVLLKFDSNGNILWKKKIGEELLRESVRAVIPTKEGGFMVIGLQQLGNTPSKFYMAKVTAEGELTWSQTAQLVGRSIPFDAQQTTDGAYLVTGFGLANAATNDFDAYVVKIDANGELVWELNYGTSKSDFSGRVHALNDGNYLLTTGNTTRDTLCFAQFDAKTGEIIREKRRFSTGISSPLTQILCPDSTTFWSASFFFNSFEEQNPMLIHFDQSGNLLDTIAITPFPATSISVLDLEPTPDGGFLLVGNNQSSKPNYGWVAKTDSLGKTCFRADCDSLSVVAPEPMDTVPIAILEPNKPMTRLQVRPNPMKNRSIINYNLSETELPAQFYLYDCTGQLVQSFSLPKNQSSIELWRQNLTPGLYFYQVQSTNSIIANGKLILE